jgi:hypothetical protein
MKTHHHSCSASFLRTHPCHTLLPALAAAAISLPSASHAQSSILYSTDFELSDPSAPLSIHGANGWSVDQGIAEIVPGAGTGGSCALLISPQALFTQASLELPRPAQDGGILFLDVSVRFPAAPWLALDETLDWDSARLGLFRSWPDAPDGEWHVFHGDGTGGGMWLGTSETTAIEQLTGLPDAWTRITFRQDIAEGTWDVWKDGQTIAAGVGLQYPPVPGASLLFVLGDLQHPVLLDDLTISTSNPLGPDADRDGILDAHEPPAAPLLAADSAAAPDLTDTDRDGLPDVWELAHGLNPEDSFDGVTDADGDGMTALDEYLTGTDPARKDTRRLLTDSGAAVFNRFAGYSARRAIRR